MTVADFWYAIGFLAYVPAGLAAFGVSAAVIRRYDVAAPWSRAIRLLALAISSAAVIWGVLGVGRLFGWVPNQAALALAVASGGLIALGLTLMALAAVREETP